MTGQQVNDASDSRLPRRFGRYTLVRRLGVGGMAEAFLARLDGPAGFSKSLVIKRMLANIASDPAFVALFHREARIASLLGHPNVVQVFEFGEVDGRPYIAMEYVDGVPLDQLAARTWRAARSLPMELVCAAAADTALALSTLHDMADDAGRPLGLVHRDITPDNIIVGRDGVARLLDFGVARLNDGQITQAGTIKGKLPYFSPEQVRGGPLDHRVDIYQLGVTLYVLLTGARPFRATGNDLGMLVKAILSVTPPPPQTLNPQVPDRVNALVLRMLEKDRDKRPLKAGEVYELLFDALRARMSVVAPFVRERHVAAAPSNAVDAGTLPAAAVSDALRSWWDKPNAGSAAQLDEPTIRMSPEQVAEFLGDLDGGRMAELARGYADASLPDVIGIPLAEPITMLPGVETLRELPRMRSTGVDDDAPPGGPPAPITLPAMPVHEDATAAIDLETSPDPVGAMMAAKAAGQTDAMQPLQTVTLPTPPQAPGMPPAARITVALMALVAAVWIGWQLLSGS